MSRTPKKFSGLADAMISLDGTSLWVRVEAASGDSLDVAIPFAELGDAVQFFVSCADFAVSHSDQADEPEPTGMQQNEWAPIPARRIGLAGHSPEETMLVVQLSCCQLAFQIAPDNLAELADGFSRIARMLSAGQGRPN